LYFYLSNYVEYFVQHCYFVKLFLEGPLIWPWLDTIRVVNRGS